jgi:Xaa-Pro aminopeptidase
MKRKPEIFNEPRIRAMMEKNHIDALILRNPENSIYAGEFFHLGMRGSPRDFVVFYFLDSGREPAFIVPLNDHHNAMDLTWISDVRPYIKSEFKSDLAVHAYPDYYAAAEAIVAERRMKGLTVGMEGDLLASGFRRRMEAMLDGNKIVDVVPLLNIARMVKTPEEQRRIKKATQITVKAHETFRNTIKPGNTDEDLYRETGLRMFKEGAHDVRFIVISAGPFSYSVHNPFPVGYTLKEGDFVRVDMGANYRGYFADFARSYFLGHSSRRQQEIHDALALPQVELGLSLKPGMTGDDIYHLGMKMYRKGLPECAREFIGHGLGLASHEQPRMNAGNVSVLEAGTVVCLENSYYHEGCRHHYEDTFLVKDKGVEHWSADCPHDFIVPA